jgi:drug/metabolite transporter (DMT)-like permease
VGARAPLLTSAGLALAVGVVAVSVSGPLIAYAAAPALAIAFWRTALALPLLVPAAAWRRRPELRALAGPARREGWLCALAGLALAGHLMAWVPSTKMTSVAASTALVTTQPVWVGLIAVALGRRLSGWTWVGIAAAVLGAVSVTGVDVTLSRTAVFGDLLALLGGVLAAVYTILGERVRATVSTTTYTTVCYGVCAAVVLAVCLAFRVPLTGYPPTAWAAIVGVTIGPQLLGHSLVNFALHGLGGDPARGPRGRAGGLGMAGSGAAAACRAGPAAPARRGRGGGGQGPQGDPAAPGRPVAGVRSTVDLC